MANKYSRGSEWYKWDLHIHTPYSHTSKYPGSTDEEKWQNFFNALESLPKEIKVIGINDYLFLEGYKKVLDYKKSGNLKNIDLILPVIEFRLKEFVGNESLNKINYHVIFADESVLSYETIEAQFLSCFRSSCNLDADDASATTWAGVVTPDSINDFGEKIYNNTPAEKRDCDNFFEIGFNSLSYNLEKLEECLGEIKETNTYLKNKYIKAIGKVEWEEFRWTGSPGDKKNIINSVNFVFSASPSVEQSIKNIETLKAQGVNNRLLHCSDSHSVKNISTDDKILIFDYNDTCPKNLGHCFTWIKGMPCFETLKQAVVDYENRVLIQDRNPMDSKSSSPELFIDRIEYELGGETKILYFSKDINSVIGKRGAGKSVLLKHIAWTVRAAEAKNIEKLESFKVFWCDGKDENKFVEYIPQNYLSTITYEDGEKYKERDQKLRELLFNNNSFKNADTRITEITSLIELKIAANTKDILKLNKQNFDTQLQLKSMGIFEEKVRAVEEKQNEIKKLGKIDITGDDIKLQTEYSSSLDKLKNEFELLEQDSKIMDKINSNSQVELFSIDDEVFAGLSQATLNLIKGHIKNLSTTDINDFLKKTSVDLKQKISEKGKEVKSFEDLLAPINEKVKQNKTIEEILKEINKLNIEKEEISKLKNSIDETREKIKTLINEIVDDYFSFKEKIENIVESLKNVFNELTFITFDFTVGYNINIYKKEFFDVFIDGRSGESLYKFIDENRDFDKVELKDTITGIVDGTVKIKTSGGDGESALTSLLKCRYEIDFTKSVKYKENNSNLINFENMTGGQKAMALLDLIFNLTKSKYPIIIDQPENDIDVSGITNELKELILKQKEKRQVIIATHSPNLLLLVDTENVIVARNEVNNIIYQNGGIEEKEIQDNIVNILEGGKEALKKRMDKLNIYSF